MSSSIHCVNVDRRQGFFEQEVLGRELPLALTGSAGGWLELVGHMTKEFTAIFYREVFPRPTSGFPP